MIVFLHVVVDWDALPVGCFEFAVFWALLCDLDFSVCLRELGLNFLLAFGADAFGFTHINHPRTASTMSASGSSIIDIVTKRSYLCISAMVELDTNKRMEE